MSPSTKVNTAVWPLALFVGCLAFVVVAWTARATDPTPAPGSQPVAAIQAKSEVRDFFTFGSAVEIIEQPRGEARYDEDSLMPTLVTSAKLRGGAVLNRGESLRVGHVVVRAILQNQGDRVIKLKNADSGTLFDLQPGEAIIIVAATSCSVTCKAGAYACCNIVEDKARCVCPPHSSIQECTIGGPGANTCAIGASEASRGRPFTGFDGSD